MEGDTIKEVQQGNLAQRHKLNRVRRLRELLGHARNSQSNSTKPIGAGAEEFEEFEVAEDLELLSDFVVDVGVLGMELG
jgi:hypothetical protein